MPSGHRMPPGPSSRPSQSHQTDFVNNTHTHTHTIRYQWVSFFFPHSVWNGCLNFGEPMLQNVESSNGQFSSNISSSVGVSSTQPRFRRFHKNASPCCKSLTWGKLILWGTWGGGGGLFFCWRQKWAHTTFHGKKKTSKQHRVSNNIILWLFFLASFLSGFLLFCWFFSQICFPTSTKLICCVMAKQHLLLCGKFPFLVMRHNRFHLTTSFLSLRPLFPPLLLLLLLCYHSQLIHLLFFLLKSDFREKPEVTKEKGPAAIISLELRCRQFIFIFIYI